MFTKFIEDEAVGLKPSLDNLEHLFYAADYLKMDSALKILYNYLHEQLLAKEDPTNISKANLLMYLRIFNIVHNYQTDHDIEPSSQELLILDKSRGCQISLVFFLAIHFERVMLDKAVLQLEPENLYDILVSNVLNLPGRDVMRTIKSWVNHDYEKRKESFESLLECVYYSNELMVRNGLMV